MFFGWLIFTYTCTEVVSLNVGFSTHLSLRYSKPCDQPLHYACQNVGELLTCNADKKLHGNLVHFKSTVF